MNVFMRRENIDFKVTFLSTTKIKCDICLLISRHPDKNENAGEVVYFTVTFRTKQAHGYRL